MKFKVIILPMSCSDPSMLTRRYFISGVNQDKSYNIFHAVIEQHIVCTNLLNLSPPSGQCEDINMVQKTSNEGEFLTIYHRSHDDGQDKK